MLKKAISNLFHKKSLKKKSIGVFENFDSFFDHGSITPSQYHENVIVHRCVNIISQAASHVPWIILKNTSRNQAIKLQDHPIYNLLKRPNNYQGGADFFSELVASKLLYGNCYVFGIGDGNFNSLRLLHPSKVTATKEYFEYRSSSKILRLKIDHKTNKCRILHIKNYNPTGEIYGVSALKAAEKSIDLHNHTTKWNCSLIKNGARPTGALILKGNDSYLTNEQFERLQEQLSSKYSGSSNSGRPLLLEGGLDWKDMSIHPKDMDFMESKNAAAREIALAFGLPPQLLGISGDNTYSNMQEARLALWEETIIPLLDKISDNLSNWMSIWFGEDLKIDFDRNSISALSEKRKNNLDKISNSNFMTINEKRAMIDLAPIEGGDRL